MSALASQNRAVALLAAAVVVAWAVSIERMSGMDAGPGTDLGGLGWYLGIWVTMTAAMMLPSAAPLVRRLRRGLPMVVFTAEYLAVWTGYGVAAYALFRLAIATGWLTWDAGGPYLAGAVIAAAGVYELTPLKARFLRHCRTAAGHSGVAYGLDCVGCCFGLMAALFALGVMSILWMALVAGVIFAEKVLPHGVTLTRLVALVFVVLGIWVVASPASVPGFTEPGGSMEMSP